MKDRILNFTKNNIKAISICLVLLVFACVVFFKLGGSLSQNDHTNYVYIKSDNTNYFDGDPGGWVLYKDAFIKKKNTINIRYGINSNNLLAEKDKDVLFVIDTSLAASPNLFCSVPNEVSYVDYDDNRLCVMNSVDSAAKHLLNLEVNNDNKVGLITYNDDYSIISPLTNDYSYFNDSINNVVEKGYTDYSKALEGIDAFLSDYTFSNDRELKIVLFIGNVSKGNNAKEKLLFEQIKEKYPKITINALHQIVNNEEILEKIINISDKQYLMTKFEEDYTEPVKNIKGSDNSMLLGGLYGLPIVNIFDQIIFNKEYTQFKIIDNINDEYFNFNNFKVIEKNSGDVSYENNTLTWTLDRQMLSGYNVYLEVELSINDDVLKTNNYIPVSKTTTIKSILTGIPDEDINTNITPFIKFKNAVYFNTNSLPASCNTEPVQSELYEVGETVDTNKNVVSCDGYKFKEWVAREEDYYYFDLDIINSPDYYEASIGPYDFHSYNEDRIFGDISNFFINEGIFNMPGFDVVLFPVFDRVSITKEMTIKTSTLDYGYSFNNKIKKLVPSGGRIEGILRSDVLVEGITRSVVSTKDSDLPVYAWYNNKILYYYSEAEKIYLNSESSRMFSNLSDLTDISGLADFDASKAFYMNEMFNYCNKLVDLTPIANWDVSNVRSFSSMFANNKLLVDLTPLTNWNVSNVTDMSYLFYGCINLEDFTPITSWEVSNVTNMESMFAGSGISDLTPLTNWNVSKVESLQSTFSECHNISDLTPISNWNLSNLKYIDYLFSGDKNVADLTPIANWDISNITNLEGMFAGSGISDLTPLANWNVSKVESLQSTFSECHNISDLTPLSNWNPTNLKNISYLFYGDTGITNLTPIANWNVSNVFDFEGTFGGCTGLTNLSGLENWDVSSAIIISIMFEKCSNLVDISAISNWQVNKATSYSYVFSECTSLIDASPINDWDIRKGDNFYYMFYKVPTHPEFTKVPGVWDRDGTFYPNGEGMPN